METKRCPVCNTPLIVLPPDDYISIEKGCCQKCQYFWLDWQTVFGIGERINENLD